MADEACAIIGMGCVFPDAPDLASFWRNLVDGVDSIRDAPSERWDPVFYDPSAHASDRLPCKRGGFIDPHARFEPTAYGIMPVAARAAEPDQLLALDVAAAALRDAGYTPDSRRERTGVILGRGNYAGSARVRLEQHVRFAEQLTIALRDLVPGVSEAELTRVKREFQAATGAAGADGMIGLVPNLTASRIAERLDFGGPAYTVDAACASALIAVDHACQDLMTGRADLMLCGGVHVCHAEAFWSVFAQLGALSRSEVIRPFDQRADGILIGEGVGVVVLKRLRDALRDGDRVYASIRGVGTSSDGKGASLMSPSVAGQLAALERAWTASGRSPDELGLLEAHGTGTPTGDGVELEALQRFFAAPRGERAGLGSVKSNIGHAMPAAGAAGLIKAALAVHHGLKPKTLHAEQPRAMLAEMRFRLQQHTERWNESRRLAAVSAFGFGGINAHLVLESAAPSVRRREVVKDATPHYRLIAADSQQQLLDALDGGRAALEGRFRLALVDPTPERIAKARRLVDRGARTSHDGIYYAPSGLLSAGGRLAYLFPGFDAGFEPKLDLLAQELGLVAPSVNSGSLEETGIAITTTNRVLHAALERLGLEPDLVAGHSIGEWSAMLVAGVVRADEVEAFNRGLRPGQLPVSDAVFLVAGCSLERALAVIHDLDDVVVSHDNCPHQVILCGTVAAIELTSERLRSGNVLVRSLPFGSGVHSRFFADKLPTHERNLRDFEFAPPRVATYSATSCEPLPEDRDAICALAVEHLAKPVRFRTTIERMYRDGARVFIEVGMGSLVAFVRDTLATREHAAIAAHVRQRSALTQLLHVACSLWVEGAAPRFEKLFAVEPAAPPAHTGKGSFALSLGVPLVRFETPLAAATRDLPRPASQPRGRVAAAYEAALKSQAAAQASVFEAWDRGTRTAAPVRRTLRRRVSLAEFPELIDHAFFRQPNGAEISDRGPVMPMTGLLELMRAAARQVAPTLKLVGFDQVWAKRWLDVAAPIDLEIDCAWDGARRLDLRIGDYAEGVALLAEDYEPFEPTRIPDLRGERPAPITASELYAEGWMFHGPAYRGIVELGPIADDGIRGRLRCGSAIGALLDNAGQLFGYFMLAQPERTFGLPIRIGKLRYHRALPAANVEVACSIQISERKGERAVCGLQLLTEHGVFASVEGWEDRCVAVDDALWAVMRRAELNPVCQITTPGVSVLSARPNSALLQQYLAGRFLGHDEKASLAATPMQQRSSALARLIAIKDAVRSHLWAREARPIFPAEVCVVSDSGDRAVCRVNHGPTVGVSTTITAGLVNAWITFDGDMHDHQ